MTKYTPAQLNTSQIMQITIMGFSLLIILMGFVYRDCVNGQAFTGGSYTTLYINVWIDNHAAFLSYLVQCMHMISHCFTSGHTQAAHRYMYSGYFLQTNHLHGHCLQCDTTDLCTTACNSANYCYFMTSL